jgi:hypothetical protein
MILLPWSLITNIDDYGLYARYKPNSSYHFGWVGFSSAYNKRRIWTYNWCDLNQVWCDIKRTCSSKEDGMKIVDEYFVSMGWKLLNEGDRLLTLL